ncbi:MAG: bifunctional glutamate N-acetyltransferase/amino-acid acetyltransferase ArgJ [Veillonellaceae bacterium]|jgi:glutamate N-acetyltransferase/amino-acid N-acetyltransferase|nr:bifunctional glutamate N-acetyltransferase/amino-acid acetyltransferase ArgJ [Veillonellaceae bacterium]
MINIIDPMITAPKGFKASGVKAGIKKSGKEDLAIVYSTVPAAGAAVFTTNVMAAAPVIVSRRNVAGGKISAFVVNAGCANACTGDVGLANAEAMARKTASLLNIEENQVVVASTGIIGVNLPMDKVEAGIEKAVNMLSEDDHNKARQAIMTTDTFPKSVAIDFMFGDAKVTMAGMAKGSGMIHPNMATMLAFITTDAAITPELLQKALTDAVNVSFNMITVDGDTSTNDMVAVMANGLAGNRLIDSADMPEYINFSIALRELCIVLAKMVARDGEGATKFLEITVKGAESFADAKKAAMAIAKSPLVKTAFFGQDPNWGRIICAVGYSEANVTPEKTSLLIGNVKLVDGGLPLDYDEQALRAVMAAHDIKVTVDLGMGQEEATVWTCDFSYEYVKINGEYHT